MNRERSAISTFPRRTSSAISRRAAGADSISRLALTESIAMSGRPAEYRRNSYTVESAIQGISTWPDVPPRATSLSSFAPVETRTSAPTGSLVCHETTQRCPKQIGFGLALICPVIGPFVCVFTGDHYQPIPVRASSCSANGDDFSKPFRYSSLKRNFSFLRAASAE